MNSTHRSGNYVGDDRKDDPYTEEGNGMDQGWGQGVKCWIYIHKNC